jgi:hypothetical protein
MRRGTLATLPFFNTGVNFQFNAVLDAGSMVDLTAKPLSATTKHLRFTPALHHFI